MATGAGKTFTAANVAYRLIKFAGARRVLFLVDRANLGRQTLKEFQAFSTPDDGRKFTELYNIQHLSSNVIDPIAVSVYGDTRGHPWLPLVEGPTADEEAVLGAGELIRHPHGGINRIQRELRGQRVGQVDRPAPIQAARSAGRSS
jgi:hypothetical protein